eukprot:s1376_g9.t1
MPQRKGSVAKRGEARPTGEHLRDKREGKGVCTAKIQKQWDDKISSRYRLVLKFGTPDFTRFHVFASLEHCTFFYNSLTACLMEDGDITTCKHRHGQTITSITCSQTRSISVHFRRIYMNLLYSFGPFLANGERLNCWWIPGVQLSTTRATAGPSPFHIRKCGDSTAHNWTPPLPT